MPSGLVVRVETAYLPPVTIQAAGGGGAGAGVNVLKLLKPAVTVSLDDTVLAREAPYGEPGRSRWPWLLAGVLLLLLVAIVALRRR
jgi:hypothetical protein